MARQHDISRNLIRIWVTKFEVGEFDDDQAAADMLSQYEARIGELERKVGQLTMENDLQNNTSRALRQPNVAPPSMVSGPGRSRSGGDAS